MATVTQRYPSGPKGMPLLGSIPEMQRKGVVDFYYGMWKTYGDFASLTLGPLRSFLIVRPEHIQHVLVKNPEIYIKGISHEKLRTAIGNGILTLEGERWTQQRRLMQPTYTPKGIRTFANLMSDATRDMLDRWDTRIAPDERVDIGGEMTRITMRVISEAMFSIDISANSNEAARSLIALLEYTSQSGASLVDTPLFIPTPRNQRLKAAKASLRAFLMGIIAKKREEGLGHDLLSLLMSSRDEETGNYMTDDQLHDEVLITIFAGHETTANLLTWTWYLLSQHPEVEEQLHAELDRALGGRDATLDDLGALPYTRQVLDEVLRIYAPTPVLARDAAAEDTIDDYHVPKGSLMIVLPYATHRHPEFWARPEAFYPDHFTPEQVEARPKLAYIPFGTGRRICIGQYFAQMEAMLILATVAQRYRPRLAQPHDGRIRFVGVARPKEPIIMTLQKRQN